MTTAAQGMMAGGSVIGALGAYRSGKLSRSLGRMRYQASKVAAVQTRASAQRAALEESRQAELKASRAVAVAAAGGGGVDDPTVINILEDIEAEGAYRSAVAMYEGESLARQQLYEGKLAEIQGEQDYKTGQFALYGGFLQAGAYAFAGGG